MAQHPRNPPAQPTGPRPARTGGASPPPQSHVPAAVRYDAPGDEPLAVPAALKLDQPFRFDRGLAKRLRMREVNQTEAFTLRDGPGAWFRATLREYDNKGGLAVAYERMGRSPEPTIDITLACAILSRQRMHLVVQKATELGVRRIAPLLTDHSVPADAVAHEQAHAWAGHAARAARQCRRSSLPHLLPPAALDAFLASPLLAAAELCLFLDDRTDPKPVPAAVPPPGRIVLFVGPEGGFSDAERHRLAARARPWVLGGRVLRAETAVIVGLTAVHMTWGDFRPNLRATPDRSRENGS
ncbi:MAG TPA: RsmE family RNA methyltransferase [Tepidisphaeraceae bacterium]|nr:RsmE family RNA methyltransferase [Tepidisphaeraceae bacterium]